MHVGFAQDSKDADGDRPTKEVQDKLRQSFRRRRESHDRKDPYPVKYSPNQSPYDGWNQMFIETLAQEPGKFTLHPFEIPPKRVLDLGCGSGYWIIEAASKHWKETTFVGLDVLRIQPDFRLMSNTQGDTNDLSNRVKWIRANFLEELPFPDDSFDFVRICGLGLAVPEDRWQDLLQEVRRVLEPGGVVEILEEDLIFPVGQQSRPSPRSDSYLSAHAPYRHSVTTPSSSSIMDHSFSLSSALGNDPHDISPESSMHSPSIYSETRALVHRDDSSSHQASDHDSITSKLDPLNHSKLKEAWQSMLHSRFLAPRLTSVLPFYINSEFHDMITHPPLFIALPSASDRRTSFSKIAWDAGRESESDPDLRTDLQDPSFRSSRYTSDSDEPCGITQVSAMNPRAVMHLARTVNIIEGCKDAIWEEYEKIAQEKRKKEPSFQHFDDSQDVNQLGLNPIKQDFEEAWANWQNDMRDRMCMRGTVFKSLSWSMLGAEEERPQWRVWRDRVDSLESTVSISSGLNATDVDLCRSLRGFVAWNTTNDNDYEPII